MAPLSAARKFRNQDTADAAAIAPNASSFQNSTKKKQLSRRNALRGDDVLLQGAIRFIQQQLQTDNKKKRIYIHTKHTMINNDLYFPLLIRL